MKKIEICAPLELLEPLRVELAAAGILGPGSVTTSCGLLDADAAPLNHGKLAKTRKATHCKVELVVSDRLAPRTVETISDLLQAHGLGDLTGYLVILDVDSNYHFGMSYSLPTPNRPEKN